jgi:hypothetical protein
MLHLFIIGAEIIKRILFELSYELNSEFRALLTQTVPLFNSKPPNNIDYNNPHYKQHDFESSPFMY